MDQSEAARSIEHSRYRKIINAWSMYDWANSAFYTTIVAAIFPPFFRSLATSGGVPGADATAYWAYVTSAGLLVVAVLGPVLGAIADQTGSKKKWVIGFAALGIVASFLMAFLGPSSYGWGAVLFIIGDIGVAASIVFYDSLLPHIAKEEDMDRVSSKGYAIGYLGGGILLVVNMLMVTRPSLFFLESTNAGIRLSFVSVAIWWAIFSIPLIRRVPEPPSIGDLHPARDILSSSLKQLRSTLRKLRRYRQLGIFLLAFLIYNDGIGTIIKMATAYGDEIGIGITDMITALILTQFVGIPCSFAFGWLAGKITAKKAILLALAVYVVIACGAYFMKTAAHFYMLAFGVGLVQGGAQALSRSLFGQMVPRSQTAEFFGFFSTSSKMAGIVGPVLFGVVSQLVGGSRLSIVSLVLFFVVGGILLVFVDIDSARRAAQLEDREVGFTTADRDHIDISVIPSS